MEFTLELLNQLFTAVVQLLLQPFYYVGIALIVLQYRRQIILERKLFHTRLHSIIHESWRMLLWGWAGGITASLLMAFIGASLSMESIYMLWVVSLLLMLFRVRFLCLAYSVGILGILHTLITWFPTLREQTAVHWLIDPLDRIQMPSLLAVVGILHFVEAILIRLQGQRLASPIVMEGKRGKLVGGYQLQGFWSIPLFLLMPTAGGTLHLPWTPLFAIGEHTIASGGGWGFIALPAVIGFTELTRTRLPADKIRRSSSLLLLYACVIILSAFVSYYWSPLIGAASLLTILLHETLVLQSKHAESGLSQLFVHDERGMKVLAVLPNSGAAELGLLPGEIIHKVNNVPVLTKQELHQAMELNSAFCRLEVINLAGHSKFVSKAIYAGDHHQLGIIFSPDSETKDYIADNKPLHFLDFLWRKR
ncbi:MAG: Trypsin-like serine protease [Bacilli bacterium]|nr:Trypsin-like serine protease [Bacilli bacterium]